MWRLLALVLCLLLCACNSNQIAGNHNRNIRSIYIYDETNDSPVDSLIVYDDFEKSLELYERSESLEKEVKGLVYFSIFKLNGQKFSVIADTATVKVFKYEDRKFKRIFKIKSSIGVQNVQIKKIDFNSDGYQDVIVSMPSGGSYGTGNICLYYHPKLESLMGDLNAEFANIELNQTDKSLISYRSLFNEKYAIQNYRFYLIERTIYLGKTSNNQALMDKLEVSKYDLNGNLIQKDTI